MGVAAPELIAGAFAPQTSVPNASGVAGQYLQLLQGFSQGAPTQLQLQQQYQPQYTALANQNLGQELLGQNGAPGYLGYYANSVVPAIASATNTATGMVGAGNTASLYANGPGAAAAIGATNPAEANLLAGLTNTATGQLNLGTQLDPNTLDQINTSVNANFANRGLGNSIAPEQLDEALQFYQGGQQALTQREGTAASVANLDNSLLTAPAISLAAPQTNIPGLGQTITGTGSGLATEAGPSLYPTSDLESLFSSAYNAQANVNNENLNAQMGLTGDIFGLEGSVLGAGGSAAGGGG